MNIEEISIQEKENFKIEIDNDLGVIKLTYIIDKSPSIYHLNILKIDEITNLYMKNMDICIITNNKEFVYKFSHMPPKKVYIIFLLLANKYINYYSIIINDKNLLPNSMNLKL